MAGLRPKLPTTKPQPLNPPPARGAPAATSRARGATAKRRRPSRVAPGTYRGPNNWSGQGWKTQPLNRAAQARNATGGQPVNQPTPAHAAPPSHQQAPAAPAPARNGSTGQSLNWLTPAREAQPFNPRAPVTPLRPPQPVPAAVFVQPGQQPPAAGSPEAPAATPTTGRTTTMNPDSLGSAPETDAAHAAWAADFARDMGDLGDRLLEHRELLESEVNMHPSLMAGLEQAAEYLSEAAGGVTSHAQDYESFYAGMREVAEQTGGAIPGMDPNNKYWAETA